MYRATRTAWGLVAIGAATAVGITTRDPGFIIITFIGALVVPRVLGSDTAPSLAPGLRSKCLWPPRQGLGRRLCRSQPQGLRHRGIRPGDAIGLMIDGAAAARRPVPPLR